MIIAASSDLALAFIKYTKNINPSINIYGTSRSCYINKHIKKLYLLDITNDADISCFVNKITSLQLDAIFIFTGTQGEISKNTFGKIERASFNSIYNVNCTSVILLLQTIINLKIVNNDIFVISSRAGSISERGNLSHHRKGGNIAYRISKAALNMGIKNISFDYQNIVNIFAIHPGWVKTKSTTTSAQYSPEAFANKFYNIILEITKYRSGTFIDVFDGLIDW